MLSNINKISGVLVVFGVIIILYPDFIGIVIGGLLVFGGINLFLFGKSFGKKKEGKEDYVKFGDYKIYRGKSK